MNADRASFERGDFAHGVRIVWMAAGRESHGGRKRCAFVQAHGRAAFEIRADEQR